MSPQPTQAHFDKATYWIVMSPLNALHQIDSLAQLIADSEARAVEVAFPDSKDDSLHNVRRLRAELAAERERHNALRQAVLDVLRDPEGRACFYGSDADRAVIDAAMKEGNK